MDEIFAAIDIGTSKTAVVIAEDSDVGFAVRGFGIAPNEGVVRGNIVNIEKAQQGILRALLAAEKQAQLKVKKLIVAIGGSQMRTIRSHGVTSISKDAGKVTISDVMKIIEAAKNITVPPDAQIVDYAISSFTVDGNHNIIDPIGMTGSRLEGDIILFVMQSAAMHNLMLTLEGADIIATDFVASPIAAAKAILSKDEKELGAAVMDIGAGTTDTVIYMDGKPRFVAIVPYAGESVIHDIMVGLKLTRSAAEKVEMEHGCAVENMIPEDEEIQIPGIGGREPRTIKKRFVSTIMEARLEEILLLARQRIVEAGGEMSSEALPAGIVLTGGASLIPQIVYLAERILNMPVRLGLPGDINPLPEGMNTPDYHTAYGAIVISTNRKKQIEQIGQTRGKIPEWWNRLKKLVLKRL